MVPAPPHAQIRGEKNPACGAAAQRKERCRARAARAGVPGRCTVIVNTNTFVLLMTKSQFKALGSLIEYKKPQKVIASELKTRIDLHDRRHGAGASDEQTSW